MTELHWEVTTFDGETRTFYDIERARALRDKHPQNGGITVVTREVPTTTGTRTDSYQRPGLHTEP